MRRLRESHKNLFFEEAVHVYNMRHGTEYDLDEALQIPSGPEDELELLMRDFRKMSSRCRYRITRDEYKTNGTVFPLDKDMETLTLDEFQSTLEELGTGIDIETLSDSDINRHVVYKEGHRPEEFGVITSFNDTFVFVDYNSDGRGHATKPEHLNFTD